jgi:U6 snRNA-associated Sm-like protein LSm6
MSKRSPADFLKQVLGRFVLVKLSSGEQYVGILASLDSFMNIVLESVEEKNFAGDILNKYSHIFLRGNNGNLYFIK